MRKFIVGIFLIWRATLELAKWLGVRVLPLREGFLGPSPFANFDGVHYLHIAQQGYAQYEQAFFPLYPLLIRLFSKLQFISPVTAGFLISNTSLIFALIIFWKLLEGVGESKQKIKWAIVFFLFFPTSFYYASIYTESLFILLILTGFYILQKLPVKFGKINFFDIRTLLKKIELLVLYMIVASLASGTRLVGAFLGIPIGLVVYMLYLAKTTGDAFMFVHAQPAFGAERSGGEIILLPQVLWRYFKIFITVPWNAYDFWIAFLELSFFAVSLFLLYKAYKIGLPKPWILFSFAAVIAPTLTGTLSSIPRYVLVAFPMYAVIAELRKKWRYLLFAVCSLLLIILTALFTQGYWVA